MFYGLKCVVIVKFDEALSSSNGVVKEGVPKFLEMQECYNICMAAYKEIMTLALKANTWVVDIPVLGSIEKLHYMFREPPSPGMEIEYSIESSVVPLRLDNVVTTMTNVVCDISFIIFFGFCLNFVYGIAV